MPSSSNLGDDWPIFILSGNLDAALTERLRSEFGIPEARIFSKPLMLHADDFVKAVLSLEDAQGVR